jgi:hypothetical protein
MISLVRLVSVACVLGLAVAGNCSPTPTKASGMPAKQPNMATAGVGASIAVHEITRVTIFREAVNREGPFRKENILSELSKTCSIKSVNQFAQSANQWLKAATRVNPRQNPFFNTAVKFDMASGKSKIIYFFFDTKSKLQKINFDENEYSIPADFDNKIIDLSKISCGSRWDYL